VWATRISNITWRKEEIQQKEFKPKFPEIPEQEDYHEIPDEVWEIFPTNDNRLGKSNINAGALKKLADSLGTSDSRRLEKVLDWIKNGAEIGCTGDFRRPTVSKNAKDAYGVGRQVTDAVACWIRDKYVRGPVKEEDVPASAKINGILTRQKPNGSVRVILNLSAPEGGSVNEGIDIEDYPAKMSSTAAWLAVLNKAGKDCWIAKTDWSDAYKHVAVNGKDLDLQWFEWGGRYFQELCLIFGCASSAGIYDAVAKTVLDLVCRLAEFPTAMVCQHLDDIVAAAPAQSEKLHEFVTAYQKVAESIGVKLAPTDDPDKAFLPCKKGVIFGVEYDTTKWSWRIPEAKLAAITNAILTACEERQLKVRQAQSLIGKLVHIKPLIPTGKFNFYHIMRLSVEVNKDMRPSRRIEISEDCANQLVFWLRMIKLCQEDIQIPKCPEGKQPWAIQAYTDAAGGTLDSVGRGSGGVMGTWWFYYPWSKTVASGGWKIEGKKVGRKLSALELIGPLIVIVAGGHKLRGLQVTIWVDNAGSVAIWEKGYSTSCPLSSAIVTTLAAVAASLNIQVQIAKITRCSNTGADMADALSKAEFGRFRQIADNSNWELDPEPATIPRSLLSWLAKPVVDFDLAVKILREMAESQEILGHNRG